MTFEEFKTSLAQNAPHTQLSPLLCALWYDAKGDWENAHRIVQDIETPEAAWIHAYLHRKEGDISNASYWYRRARKPIANCSLPEEWEQIASDILQC